jgi:hypothetical protein
MDSAQSVLVHWFTLAYLGFAGFIHPGGSASYCWSRCLVPTSSDHACNLCSGTVAAETRASLWKSLSFFLVRNLKFLVLNSMIKKILQKWKIK